MAMTQRDHDDLWRDFPRDGDRVRGAVCGRGGLPGVLVRPLTLFDGVVQGPEHDL